MIMLLYMPKCRIDGFYNDNMTSTSQQDLYGCNTNIYADNKESAKMGVKHPMC